MTIESMAGSMTGIVDPAAQIRQLASGFQWSEGPIWDRQRERLYFSDVPQNTIFSWSESDGLQTYRAFSGLPEGADDTPFDSAGTNGLIIGRDGRLIAASHGKRAVTAIDLDSGDETILADRYAGQPFNSPNDLIEARDGTLYFTDPPYGLKGGDSSPLKRQAANGVYRRDPGGAITLIDDSLTRPNGIALSPDETVLYVSQSDPARQILKSYRLPPDRSVADLGVFFDAMPLVADDAPGLPDGMCVAATGHIFATGPGGILILDPEGELLGRIRTARASANCTFGNADGKMLYITSSDALLQIPLKVGSILI